MWDWDEDKRQANLVKHGVDFAQLTGFDVGAAIIKPDDRRDYGEPRFEATS